MISRPIKPPHLDNSEWALTSGDTPAGARVATYLGDRFVRSEIQCAHLVQWQRDLSQYISHNWLMLQFTYTRMIFLVGNL